jgi:hypothetical protein
MAPGFVNMFTFFGTVNRENHGEREMIHDGKTVETVYADGSGEL